MRTGLMQPAPAPNPCAPMGAKARFRAHFQRALRSCVRRRFSVAECFGVIWLETLEEVALTDGEQSELYEELIQWAKHRLVPDVLYSSLRSASRPTIPGVHPALAPADVSARV